MKKTVFIILLIFSSFSFGQNNCGNFKNYEESQNWIKKIKQLNPNERKDKIFERINCEQESERDELDFRLTIIINGNVIAIANDFSKEQTETLKLFPSDKIIIAPSLCEFEDVYPQKCNLGFVILQQPDKPVLNEISELKNIRLKRRKGKIIIKLESEIESVIEFEVNHLLKNHSTILNARSELKKGENKFIFKRSASLQIIEAEIKEKKLIIII